MAEPKRYVQTLWEAWTYDVMGNGKEGYWVNDRRCLDRQYPLRLVVQTANKDTPQEFEYAFPSDKQLREALQLRRIKIETEGDDTTIYVNAARDGYPVGEYPVCLMRACPPIRE